MRRTDLEASPSPHQVQRSFAETRLQNAIPITPRRSRLCSYSAAFTPPPPLYFSLSPIVPHFNIFKAGGGGDETELTEVGCAGDTIHERLKGFLQGCRGGPGGDTTKRRTFSGSSFVSGKIFFCHRKCFANGFQSHPTVTEEQK